MSNPAPIAVVSSDSKRRFNLGRLLPKVDRYLVYAAPGEGITIVPVFEEGEQS